MIGTVALLTIGFAAGCAAKRTVEPSPRLAPAPPPERPKLPNPWFMRQRNESGVMPLRARARALEALRSGGELAVSGGSWLPAGPVNIGGRVSALAVDPTDTERIWLGAADGGVFLSEDGGSSWTPVFDDQTALSIGAIAAHPTDPDTLWVGTGEETGGGYSYDGEGVFRTTDGGQSWTDLGLAEVRRIGKLAVDPSNPERVFVAAVGGLHNLDEHRGVYRSTDGGGGWVKVLYIQDDTGAIDVAIDPQNPDRVFAAIWQRSRADNHSYYGGAASGIYRSTDGGDSWTQLASGLPSGTGVGRIGVAVAASNPQFVYAVIVNSSGTLDGVYRSTNGGDSWSEVSSAGLPSSFSTYGYYFGQIRVDPTDENTVYVGDLWLWRSTNGGSSFSAIGTTMHVDVHAIEVGPGSRLLVGNDGGFYRSDNGTTFVHNQTLAITQFYDLCVDPNDSDKRFGGTQDNGTMRTVTAGDDDWQIVYGGDGMHCVVDPVDGNRVYAEAQWGFIGRSTNGGASFSSATNGIASSDRNNWVTPITHDPLVTSVLYTGTQRVYRTENAALSWTPISDDLSNGPGDHDVSNDPHWRDTQDHGQHPIQGTLTAIGVSALDTDVIWAGTDDGNVWYSDDYGSSWNQVNPPGPAYWVTEIAPDPFDVDGAYLTVAGYRSNDTMPYLRYTDDLGNSWQDLSAGLPQVPLNEVVADPEIQGRLYVASDLGVHVSDDGGSSWAFLGTGMPYVVVLDMILDQGTRKLFAGTHARSMFSFDLDQLPPPDADGDGVGNNEDCALNDPGAWAVPAEVELTVDPAAFDEVALTWTDLSAQAGPDVVYDIAKGDVSVLRISGTTTAIALDCDYPATLTSDGDNLDPDEAFYYLARGKNVCGNGTWGLASDGPRFVPVCP